MDSSWIPGRNKLQTFDRNNLLFYGVSQMTLRSQQLQVPTVCALMRVDRSYTHIKLHNSILTQIDLWSNFPVTYIIVESFLHCRFFWKYFIQWRNISHDRLFIWVVCLNQIYKKNFKVNLKLSFRPEYSLKNHSKRHS